MDTVAIEDFKKLDLRTAVIKKAEPHPNADRLYIVTVDVGGTEKVVVAGIRAYYTAEELVGKRVVVINNLKPSVIRGVESNGMILAAKDASILTLITPERDLASGSSVS